MVVLDFVQQKTLVFHPDSTRLVPPHLSGHGGADFYLMESFVSAVAVSSFFLSKNFQNGFVNEILVLLNFNWWLHCLIFHCPWAT